MFSDQGQDVKKHIGQDGNRTFQKEEQEKNPKDPKEKLPMCLEKNQRVCAHARDVG